MLRRVLIRLPLLLILVGVALADHTQAEQGSPPIRAEGMKVIEVKADGPGAKAGLKIGDIILSWSQDSESGLFFSPADLKAVYRERWPRGAVTLSGTRNGESLSWVISGVYWGIETVPVSPSVQAVLDRMQELAKAKQMDAMAEYCRTECVKADAQTGARSYLLFQAGILLASSDRLNDAKEFYDNALEETPKDLLYLKPQIYEKWADEFFAGKDWASAATYYEKALREYEQISQPSFNEAYYLDKLAEAKANADLLPAAIQIGERAVTTRRLLRNENLLGGSLERLAYFFLRNGEPDSAEALMKESLALALKVRPEIVPQLYLNLGAVSMVRGDPANGEKYLLQGLSEAKKTPGSEKQVPYIWNNLGAVARERWNFARAEYYLTRAAELFEKQGAGAELEWASSLSNLADVKHAMHDEDGAATLLRKALSIQEHAGAAGKPSTAITLQNYGEVLRAQGDLKGSEKMFLRALDALKATNPLQSNFLQSNLFKSAGVHASLGQLYLQGGDLLRAETEERTAIDKLRALAPEGIDHAQSVADLASIEEQLGRPADAIRDYSQAIDLFNRQGNKLGVSDSVHFGSSYSDYCSRFAAILFSQGQSVRAFEVLDHSRAQTLVRTLAESHVDIRSGSPSSLLEKDRKLEAKLTELSDQRIRLRTQDLAKDVSEIDGKIAATRVEHDSVEEELRDANPRYAALTQPKLPGLRQIQKVLEPETVLLEYSLAREHSYVVAVDRNHMAYFRLPPKAEIDALARATYGNWSKTVKRGADADRPAQKLSDIALAPVMRFIQGKRRLLIVADGGLQYVPFAALPFPRQSKLPPQLLASQFEVVYTPSAALLATLRAHPRPANQVEKSIAIIGDPVFGKDDPRVEGGGKHAAALVADSRGEDADPSSLEVKLEDVDNASRGMRFARLIHSREEADAIASVSAKQNLIMALDFDANRAAVLEPRVTRSRIVHFSTHGIFDARNPAMSGLILSMVDRKGRPQLGFLGLDDIYRSHFSADLVVLSACETALGEEVGGEGLVGLTWGFIYAGAKSVVASLWPVNDASTAEMMELFYTGIERRGLSPAAALREAQLTISHQARWVSPYYWAGFVIEGDYKQ